MDVIVILVYYKQVWGCIVEREESYFFLVGVYLGFLVVVYVVCQLDFFYVVFLEIVGLFGKNVEFFCDVVCLYVVVVVIGEYFG